LASDAYKGSGLELALTSRRISQVNEHLGYLNEAREALTDAIAYVAKPDSVNAIEFRCQMAYEWGAFLFKHGSLAEAHQAFARAFSFDDSKSGPSDLDVATNMHDLAIQLHQAGENTEAHRLFTYVLVARERLLGSDDPLVHVTRTVFSAIIYLIGEHERALAMAEEALPPLVRLVGPGHPWTKMAAARVAEIMEQEGRPGDAAELMALYDGEEKRSSE
jgi:tetratricopeptide (TPR) repeat protein